jgi:hypothetical protein
VPELSGWKSSFGASVCASIHDVPSGS